MTLFWPEMCWNVSVASNLHAAAPLGDPEGTRNLSWLGLVAHTAFGGMEVLQLRAEVFCRRAPRRGVEGLRLIVQTYAREALAADRRPRGHARPIASVQRMVSPAEVESGVSVDLLQFDAGLDEVTLVAWLEDGDTQLEYDARAARPTADCWYGASVAERQGVSRVELCPPAG